jgi:hypothetical protein
MKPHEETWTVEYDNDEGPGGEGLEEWFRVGPDIRVDIPRFEAGGRERAEAIAKLVAQAPVMARLLLEAHDNGVDWDWTEVARRVLRDAGVW